MKKRILAILGALLMMASSANATLMLNITDGIHTATYSSLGTSISTGGDITLGSFTANISGMTDFGPGSVMQDTSALNIKSSAAGNLKITLTDTSYALGGSPSIAEMIIHTNVNHGGSVTFSGYYDNGNAPGSLANLIATLGPYTTGSFDGAITKMIATDDPFSLTEVIDIAFSGAGQIVSLDTTLSATPVPEPGTMALLGVGFFGLAIYGKRRRNG